MFTVTTTIMVWIYYLIKNANYKENNYVQSTYPKQLREIELVA